MGTKIFHVGWDKLHALETQQMDGNRFPFKVEVSDPIHENELNRLLLWMNTVDVDMLTAQHCPVLTRP